MSFLLSFPAELEAKRVKQRLLEEDPVQRRLRLAEEEKQRKMKEFQKKAEDSLRQRVAEAERKLHRSMSSGLSICLTVCLTVCLSIYLWNLYSTHSRYKTIQRCTQPRI